MPLPTILKGITISHSPPTTTTCTTNSLQVSPTICQTMISNSISTTPTLRATPFTEEKPPFRHDGITDSVPNFLTPIPTSGCRKTKKGTPSITSTSLPVTTPSLHG